MLTTFSFQRKYMPIISVVGLFCRDKETPNKKVVNMSKFSESYFRFNEEFTFYIIIIRNDKLNIKLFLGTQRLLF